MDRGLGLIGPNVSTTISSPARQGVAPFDAIAIWRSCLSGHNFPLKVSERLKYQRDLSLLETHDQS